VTTPADGASLPAWRRKLGAVATLRTAFALVTRAAPREVTVAATLSVVGSLAAAAELLVIRQIVDLVTTDGRAADLVPWLAALSVTMVVAALAATAVSETRVLLSELVQRAATRRLLEVATAAELEDFEQPDFHDSIQRAREHAESSAWGVVWGLIGLVTTATSVIAVGIVLFSVAPLLVLVAMVAFVPLVVVASLNSRAMYRMDYELAEVDRDREYHERLMTGRVEAKEIRAFGLAPWLLDRHERLFAERIGHTRRVVAQRVTRALIGSALTTVVIVGALGMVAVLVLDDRVSVSDGAVAVLALHQIGGRLRSLGDLFASVVEGVSYLRDFEHLRTGRRTDDDHAASITGAPQRIELRHVGYTYPTGISPAVRDVSLTLEPGKVIALVGPNGSGKSTLAKILSGLLAPREGQVSWNGLDLTALTPADLAHWRSTVAPVFQDFTRYEHRAAEAIAFGDITVDATPARIARAAADAGADQFLERLKQGYDTRLSTAYSDGTDLSVGQWQRLAIARAFYRDAPLIVMDEPAASLDPRAERALIEHLHHLGKGKMVVFVSHRFSTVRHAHEILVMLDGEVVERGTHDDLIRRGAVYAELYRLQTSGGQGDNVG